MLEKKQKNRTLALAALGCLAIGGGAIGLVEFGKQSDVAARVREETVVSNGLTARAHEIEALIRPNVIWDEAVRHLDNKFNLAWARENIGNYLSESGSFQFALVVNRANVPLYGVHDGEDADAAQRNQIAEAAQNLVQQVRTAEAARRTSDSAHVSGVNNSIQRSDPIWLNDRLYLVTATLVQSDFGHAQVRHKQAPIVITGREFDETFLAALQERFLLTGLHLHFGDSRSEADQAHAPIFDRSGQEIATLDWLPPRPGTRLLKQTMPWVIGGALALLTAVMFLYRRSYRHAMQLAESERQSVHMAYHDALTGLPNRAHFERKLVDAVVAAARSGKPFAIYTLGMDRFKELNDVHGHQVGDEVLRAVPDRLWQVAGADGFCARLGSDEFAVLGLVEDQSAAQLLGLALIDAMQAPFDLSVGAKVINCSVGAFLSVGELFEPMELLRRADLALTAAKGAGRNCLRFFSEDMDTQIKLKRMLREDLKEDLRNERLYMVYQPQVRWSGEIVGLEALVRWNHAAQGPISPSIFVPIAEEAGLIAELGEFTLRQAAIDSARWPNLKIAVNVSATQIQDPHFPAKAKAIVESVGASCSSFEIEMTEGVLFSDEGTTRAALEALHEAGFSIALDDFGTGYSSLSYLQRFPIDKIKIDRSFVTELGRDRRTDALFSAIVNLAKALHMGVIAEGVETREQWLRLSLAGCPKIQGYVASPPIRADDIAGFIADQNPGIASKVTELQTRVAKAVA